MADWTEEEYKSLLNYKPRNPSNRVSMKKHNVRQIFDYIDWNELGYVTPVKDQGSCGSCWAFSAVAPLESAYAIQNDIKGGNIPRFSEQQIVDCSHEFGSIACDGGYMDGAMEHWKTYAPILENEYKYTGVEGECREKELAKTTKSPIKKISGHRTLNYDSNGEEIMSAIHDAPISVAVDASGFAFQFYSKGVVSTCRNTGLNHGVTVVGYDTLNGKEFFLIKNSWGERWGDHGYIRLATSGNNCGVNEEPLVVDL
jgi:C1A family cysteine protease